MRFSCQSCQAKYSIPDERVEGKVIRLKCQKCQAEIVVKGPAKPTQQEAKTEIAPAPPVNPKPTVARVEDRPAVRLEETNDAFGSESKDDDEPRESTRIANLQEIEGMRRQALAEAAQPQAKPAPKKAAPAEPVGEWLVLIGGKQHGPHTEAQILEKIAKNEIHARSYLWKEGMPEWQRASQIAPFAAAFPEQPKAAEPKPADAPAENFDAIFGPRNVPPPLDKPLTLDPEPPSVPQMLDVEHSGPLSDLPELREPTTVMQAARPPPPTKKSKNVIIIAAAAVVVVILSVFVLNLLGVFGGDEPASQPVADGISDEEKARLREGLLGKKELKVEGAGLAKETVQKVIDDNRAALQACADKRAEKAEGRVDLVFTIDATGAVTEASAKHKDAELDACLTAAVRALKFPQFSGAPVAVEYPFILSQGS